MAVKTNGALIVCAFTFVLFLCGYVLQQQTLHNLQAAIKPNFPQPIPAPVVSRYGGSDRPKDLGRARGSTEHQFYLSAGSRSKERSADWKKLAYVQIVRDHSDVCASVMLFADLARLKSPAQRILLFPREWAVQADSDKSKLDSEQELLISKRLLKWAARRYNVDLRPLEPSNNAVRSPFPAPYSFTAFFKITDMDRVMFLPPPGLIFDALPLDMRLAYSPSQDFGALTTSAADSPSNLTASVVMVQPSRSEHSRLRSLQSTTSQSDSELLHGAFPAHALPTRGSGEVPLEVADAAYLRRVPDDFDGSAFEERITFVRMWDDLLPGPEFDAPRDVLKKAWPRNIDAKYVYRNLFDKFRQRRMDVCGLGLEQWPEPSETEL